MERREMEEIEGRSCEGDDGKSVHVEGIWNLRWIFGLLDITPPIINLFFLIFPLYY